MLKPFTWMFPCPSTVTRGTLRSMSSRLLVGASCLPSSHTIGGRSHFYQRACTYHFDFFQLSGFVVGHIYLTQFNIRCAGIVFDLHGGKLLAHVGTLQSVLLQLEEEQYRGNSLGYLLPGRILPRSISDPKSDRHCGKCNRLFIDTVCYGPQYEPEFEVDCWASATAQPSPARAVSNVRNKKILFIDDSFVDDRTTLYHFFFTFLNLQNRKSVS